MFAGTILYINMTAKTSSCELNCLKNILENDYLQLKSDNYIVKHTCDSATEK